MHVTIAGSLLSRTLNDDQLGRVSLGFAAFDGEIGTGAIPIDDPTATDDFKGGRQIRVDEIDTLLVDGFISDQDRVRGPVPIVNREVVYGVQDPNALLFARRAVRSRPSETDVARVLAFAALDLSGVDTTWVLNTNTATMSAKRYDGEGWAELIGDTVNLTGKTTFIHDKAAGGRCLHYHRLTEGHTCGLTITDVVGDVNDTTHFAPWDPQKKTSPAELGNDLLFVDQANRTASYTNATSITNHDADGLAHQKIMRVEADSQAELDAIAAAQGAETKDERFTWTCTIGPLDATALSRIRVGDLITTTSQVMGLTAAVKRIAHMRLTLTRDRAGRAIPGLWNAELELGAPIRRPFAKGRSLPKLPPGVGPYTPYDPSVVDANTLDFGSGSVENATLDADTATLSGYLANVGDFAVLSVFLDAATIDATPSGGWSPHPGNPGSVGSSKVYMFYKPGVGVGDSVTIDWTPACDYQVQVDVIENADSFYGFGFTSGSGTLMEFGGINGMPGSHILLIGSGITGGSRTDVSPADGTDGFGNSAGFANSTPFIANAIHTWPGEFRVNEELAGTINASASWAGLSYAFTQGEAPTPIPGTPVHHETVGTGDGTTVTFSTDFEFVPGTLEVSVDGIPVDIDVDSTDPTGRTFTLDFAPSGASNGAPAETITVDYVIA